MVLTTSTLNRVMVVELALPAALPGFLVAMHYFVQLSRPRFGHASDRGGRRTPWIRGGMALLALGGLGAAGGRLDGGRFGRVGEEGVGLSGGKWSHRDHAEAGAAPVGGGLGSGVHAGPSAVRPAGGGGVPGTEAAPGSTSILGTTGALLAALGGEGRRCGQEEQGGEQEE